MKKIFISLTALFLFYIPLTIGPVSAETDESRFLEVKRESLAILIASMAGVSDEIESIQKQLGSSSGLGREKRLQGRIETLDRKLKELSDHFDLLAAGVNASRTGNDFEAEFNWNKELKTLVGPLVHELQELTHRPREIEQLRADVAGYSENIIRADQAIRNLKNLITISTDMPALSEKLHRSLRLWKDRKREWEALNRITIGQLELKSSDTSITKSLQDIPRVFFKSHGRNMLIAFFVFLVVTFVMFRLYWVIEKISPIHTEKRSFYGRLFDLGYGVVSVLAALLGTLAVLYFFSDWVLLSIGLIFIFGVVWASKQALPSMWAKVKLILNLGPVKEGEIIQYNGIIYQVRSINLYTTIENPVIQGGRLKIPLRDILDLRSRPALISEPWFPTKPGDWVVTNGNRCGQVEIQTPETVKIVEPGGAALFYPTATFLELTPMNLSSGFRVLVTFGIDYQYQADITEAIPAVFAAGISEGLVASGFKDLISDLAVHFKAASASSLDLEVLADFNGDAGKYYPILDREVQKACVDVCNKNRWTIPFMQVQLHVDNPISGVG